ncbi:proline dehydrogenase 1, mitochondrial-like [Asparagus officinalis]|uniref:proline dehydrogenase 1, mitochondrial-like n=1 Tax=Asparagus officinalis TaxID=4686 RepID=UPI00098E47FA|nr:proline dehydrogenase 1, mitochondrial-like [Asparagus officinalis]
MHETASPVHFKAELKCTGLAVPCISFEIASAISSGGNKKTHCWTSHGNLIQSPTKPPPLTEIEELSLRQSLNRLSTLCNRCVELNLSILIEAEYSTVQLAIDYFTYSAALEFNKKSGSGSAMVLGTVQCYVRDAKERLAGIVGAAEREGFVVGVKLVRGVYMTREREMAATLGVESPIHGERPSIFVATGGDTNFN